LNISKTNKEQFLVVVKTYPTPSLKYMETVCVAGVMPTGEWRRLYPLTFRYLPYEKQFPKYNWLSLEMYKKEKKRDFRLDSYSPTGSSIEIGEMLSTKNDPYWDNRKPFVLKRNRQSLEEIVCLYKQKAISLGTFKPKEIDFYITKSKKQWSQKRVNQLSQLKLFGPQPKELEQIPYEFRYKFRCDDKRCKKMHDIQIIDWEIYQSFRAWRSKYTEKELLVKIQEKWLDQMWASSRDSYLIVGSSFPNPTFLVLGVFWPKKK